MATDDEEGGWPHVPHLVVVVDGDGCALFWTSSTGEAIAEIVARGADSPMGRLAPSEEHRARAVADLRRQLRNLGWVVVHRAPKTFVVVRLMPPPVRT